MKKFNTNSLMVVANQQPGTVTFKNYEELKSQIEKGVEYYNGITYSLDNIDAAINNRDELKTVKKALEDKKKEIEAAYKAPYIDFEKKLEELIDMVKVPFKIADDFIKSSEKAIKEKEIREYAEKKAAVLGEYAEKIITSEKFFNPKWLNATYRAKQWQGDIDDIVIRASDDIKTIQTTAGKNTAAAMAHYYKTLSIDSVKDFVSELKTAGEKTEVVEIEDDGVVGYKVLKVYGSERKMLQIMTQFEMMDVEYEEIEDGMPKSMTELTDPNFDTFVAFDIEHTGTFGAANGDSDSEIIEIGAVKVVNGVVVDKFIELCNPGRKITPRIVRLTHITDEMVKDMPSAVDTVKKFKEFVGDMILVGHNIKSCDLPHILRTAQKGGFTFENSYLDTKPLANKKNEEYKLPNIKLKTLSEYFGIEQSEEHRAWCDAEANAYVYLRMRD